MSRRRRTRFRLRRKLKTLKYIRFVSYDAHIPLLKKLRLKRILLRYKWKTGIRKVRTVWNVMRGRRLYHFYRKWNYLNRRIKKETFKKYLDYLKLERPAKIT